MVLNITNAGGGLKVILRSKKRFRSSFVQVANAYVREGEQFMDKEDNRKKEIVALHQRFAALLSSDSLSDEEKQKLSQEMLIIIYQNSEEVTL